MIALREFDSAGVLPPGDYPMTIAELAESMLVLGPKGRGAVSGWDAAWRYRLVQNLDTLVGQLWSVGLEDVFIDGSFVEDNHLSFPRSFGSAGGAACQRESSGLFGESAARVDVAFVRLS